MDRGLYVAASGMLAELARQDVIANDLANTSTPGYKSDKVSSKSFDDVMLENTATGQTIGPMGTGVRIAGKTTDLTAEPLKQTDEPLDLGIQGDGFFAVRTSSGTQYTRNGSFHADSGGKLVDQLGNSVLGQDGNPVSVKKDGTVDATKVGVFALTGARKAGDNYFSGSAQGKGSGTVQTGMLEGSGVDASRTIVEMMGSLRAFEAGQKAITTIDETLKAATSQVGSLTG